MEPVPVSGANRGVRRRVPGFSGFSSFLLARRAAATHLAGGWAVSCRRAELHRPEDQESKRSRPAGEQATRASFCAEVDTRAWAALAAGSSP
jgi:hypothetical protein